MTQTVPDISPLMPMHQDPLLVRKWYVALKDANKSRTEHTHPNIIQTKPYKTVLTHRHRQCPYVLTQVTDAFMACGPHLTLWGRDKMAAITTFSYASSSMKTFEFQIKFHWNMILRVLIRVDPCILDTLKNMADCGETRSCMHSELIRHERGLFNARIDRIL